jgi:hypothetical protein
MKSFRLHYEVGAGSKKRKEQLVPISKLAVIHAGASFDVVELKKKNRMHPSHI